MKRFFCAILIFVFIAGTSLVMADTDLPKPGEIVCTCGCEQLAIECRCPMALELLKKYKGA